ncbi:MAG TPA: pitrilysin family protein [Geopsychrobacteraceae bacterium]|nr:pitrilysin family protein [Geopsychrobacteraceae bacterium]
MSRLVFAAIFFCLLQLACTPATTVRPDQLTFPELEFDFPTVEKRQLDNGMRLYLLPDHELPLVELSLTVGGGSTLDDPRKSGISNLFAAVLENGGAGDRSPQQVEDELEEMAAELGVSRDDYSTNIVMSLRSQDLHRGLNLLADLLRRPQFDQKRFELSRKQLRERVRRQNDNPSSIAGRTLAKATYGEHSFGRFATLESIDRIERSDLLEIHQAYFQPNNVWLAISGDVEPDLLVPTMNRLFGDWQSSGIPDLDPQPLPKADDPAVWVANKDIPQTTILMGHRGIEKDNPDLFALKVANYILGGGGFNSRMMREIRSNRGLAYSVYSYFQVGRRLPQMFVASCETKASSTIAVVELMRSLIQQLREEPVTEEELSLARESLINSFVFAFDDSQSVVSRRVRLDFYDYPPQYLEDYREKIAAVTVEDVQRVAREYLHPDQLQIVLVGKTADFDRDPDVLGPPVRQVDLESKE